MRGGASSPLSIAAVSLLMGLLLSAGLVLLREHWERERERNPEAIARLEGVARRATAGLRTRHQAGERTAGDRVAADPGRVGDEHATRTAAGA